MKPIFASMILTAASVAAQTASGPVLAWTVDAASSSARTIYGVPGSSRQGDVLAIPAGVRILQLNPASSLSVALTGDNAAPVVYDLADGSRTALEGARPGPSAAAWSSGGTALVLSYESAAWVQVFNLTGGSWKLAQEFASLAVRAAVSDDGTSVMLMQPDGLVLHDASGIRKITADAVLDFTFLAGSSTTAIQTAAKLKMGDQEIAVTPVDGEAIYLGSVRGGRLAVVTGGGHVLMLDAAGQKLADANCGCKVTGLGSAGRPDTIRLLTDSGGPLWLADAGSEPRVYFVPAPASVSESAQ